MMFKRIQSFVDKANSPEVTSLNLQTPPKPAAPEPSAALTCRQINIGPEMKARGEEVGRRLQEWLKSGEKPTIFFVLMDPRSRGPLALMNNERKGTILLFTSQFVAKDYASVRNAELQIAVCEIKSLPTLAQMWIAAGVTAFTINSCPRCKTGNVFKIESLQPQDQFMTYWAAETISKKLYAELLVRECYTHRESNPKLMRSNLERVRDHFDCGNPYVHWLIAITAGMEGDMQANAAAITRLEEFGPPFVGKLKGQSFDFADPESQIRTMPEAMIGLIASYGLLKLPNQPAAE